MEIPLLTCFGECMKDLEQMSSREEWEKQDQEKERREEDKELPSEGQQLPGTAVCVSLIRKALSAPSVPMKSLQPAFYPQENRDAEG